MAIAYRKLLVMPLLAVLLACGSFVPARAESGPHAVTMRYIQQLYYATRVKQLSKFWIKNARVPMDELMGAAEARKLAELKGGYLYNPKITAEVINGNVATLKGTGLGYSNGQRTEAELNVILHYEEGSWHIQYYTWQGSIMGHY